MENGDIIVIDNVRELLDNQLEVIGRVITDKAGNEIKIKKGQGGKLQDRWDWLDNDGIGQAIKLKVELYKGKYPYVADFEVVKDEFVKQAAEKIQKQTDREDSIESQVAFKGMIELLVAGIIKPDSTEGRTTIDWALGRLNPAVEIVSVIEKSTPKVAIVEEEPQNAKELLNWIISKDPSIKMPRTWLNENFAVDSKTVLNPEKVKELYEAIKIGMGW